jgi:hypothetical protein
MVIWGITLQHPGAVCKIPVSKRENMMIVHGIVGAAYQYNRPRRTCVNVTL